MSVFGFAERAELPERIDDPALPEAVRIEAMRDLEKVNRTLRAYRPTLAFLRRAARIEGARGAKAPLRLLDVGAGHGDLLRTIAAWAAREGISLELTGLDLSPACTRAAALATPPELGIRYLTGDVFTYRPESPPDLIVSSLFTHHLSNDEIVRFLLWMEEHARLGWQVSDLHRHPLAWIGFRALAGLRRWHPVVRHDGAVSVRRGFTRGDWSRYLEEAGIRSGVRVRGWLPFRYTVERVR